MKLKIGKKCAAFLMSIGLLATSGEKNLFFMKDGLFAPCAITASAGYDDLNWNEKTVYTYTYENVVFQFIIDGDESIKKACIIGIESSKNLSSELWIPSTVSLNSKNYTVVDICCDARTSTYKSSVEKVYIPSTVTTLDQNAFNGYVNLKEVRFLIGNTNSISDNACKVQRASARSFDSRSPFIKRQYSAKGYATLGKNLLLSYPTSNATTLRISDDNIKYIADEALGCDTFPNLKVLYLPKNLLRMGCSVFSKSLNTVMYWDTKEYRNLVNDVTTSKTNSSLTNIMKNADFSYASNIYNAMANALAKKALTHAGVTYKGAVCSGYDAWQQYQIVYKLYSYVGNNYIHYDCSQSKSPNFVSEMYQTELMGYKGKNQTKGIMCHDYAQMFEKLCIAAGIEAKYVETEKTVKTEMHAFNIVKIGEKWFNLDCCRTWCGLISLFMTADKPMLANTTNHRKNTSSAAIRCECLMGDVDRDGQITQGDANLIQKIYAEIMSKTPSKNSKYSPMQKVLSDVDRNGTVTIEDAQLTLMFATEKTSGNFRNFEQFYAYYLTKYKGRTSDIPDLPQFVGIDSN